MIPGSTMPSRARQGRPPGREVRLSLSGLLHSECGVCVCHARACVHACVHACVARACREKAILCYKRTSFLCSMIRDTTRLYRKFYQKRVKATVLYATETGRSRSYANIVKDVFGKVFAAKVSRGQERGEWRRGEGGRRGGG